MEKSATQNAAQDAANNGSRPVNIALWPKLMSPLTVDPIVEARVESILARLTLEEKVGQTIQADIGSVTPDDLRAYPLGSILNGGNTAPNGDMGASREVWLSLADAYWDASMREGGSRIPIMWGTDAVHGNNNVAGSTIFPHNVGLGAMGDEALIERIGAVTARETIAAGFDWTFAPTLAVVQDIRWGRTYESYSEDPAIVAKCGAALIRGLQGKIGTKEFLGKDKIIATVKHFIGDGGTLDGRDQGDTDASEAQLRDIHSPGIQAALNAGVQSVMASFSSWGDIKIHGRHDLLTELLKDRWGFDGVLVGDWNGHGQLTDATPEHAPESMMAGLDMYMAPDSWKALYHNTIQDVQTGLISQERLDDAVRRILRVKIRTGLLDAPRPSGRISAQSTPPLSPPEHIIVAQEAVRKSAVLLKNKNAILPLHKPKNILVAGAGANNLSMHCGGWSLSWQGNDISKSDFPESETLLEGIERIALKNNAQCRYSQMGEYNTVSKPDVAIYVFGEQAYAEFRGDLNTLDFLPGDTRDIETIRKLKADGIPVIGVFLSGRPLWVNPEINACDAFVAAFLPGTQGGALADILFAQNAEYDFSGKLSFFWPINADQYGATNISPLFPRGFGLSLQDVCTLETLHETGVETEADNCIVFNKGSAVSGWTATLEDKSGTAEWVSGTHTSPTKTLTVHTSDFGQQENAVHVKWDKNTTGSSVRSSLTFVHEPIDFSRETNADFLLTIDYHLLNPPAAPVFAEILDMHGNGARIDITAHLQTAAEGEVKHVTVALKHVTAANGNVHMINRIALATNDKFELIITRIAFEPGVNCNS